MQYMRATKGSNYHDLHGPEEEESNVGDAKEEYSENQHQCRNQVEEPRKTDGSVRADHQRRETGMM
jgi:cell division septal protein FtsQ